MQVFNGIAEAADRVREFFYANKAALPPHVVSKVDPYVRTGSSPVDLIAHFTEAVYANRDSVPAEGMELAAGCANLIDQDGYHGRLDDRASAMSFALRRDSGEQAGEGRAWPAPETDPAVKAEYGPPPEMVPPAPPGEA